MRSTNLFIVRGYTGADAKAFDGGKVAKVSVATNRVWTDRKSGERKEATDWATITILTRKSQMGRGKRQERRSRLRRMPSRGAQVREGRQNDLHHGHHRQRLRSTGTLQAGADED